MIKVSISVKILMVDEVIMCWTIFTSSIILEIIAPVFILSKKDMDRL